MTHLKKIVFTLTLGVLGTVAQAQQPAGSSAMLLNEENFQLAESELLRAIGRPDFRVESTRLSETMPGMLEMQIENGPLLFVNPVSKHFIEGTLFGYGSGRLVNVSEQAMMEFRRKELAKIDTSDMIIFPSGQDDKKLVVYIFTDVDCGHCRILHNEVPTLNARGVEVRYLAYPRAGIGSPTYLKMQSAWCADDRRRALTRLKADQSVEPKVCDNPINQQFILGQKMGVSGTPAIVTPAGRLIPGRMEAARLIRLLESE